MGSELDIAGTFIYDGMRTLDEIITFESNSEIFSFLYHVSVGIERLQKVLIVLLEEINNDNMRSFEKGLITHSHQELQNRIKNKSKITFSPKENSFLQILNEFYNKYRYDRYNILSHNETEKVLIDEYILKWVNSSDYERNIISDSIVNNDKIKDIFGRIIGSISKKYYSKIYECASEQNIYTYELRSGSKAEKVFLNEFRKNSLYEQTFNEKIAFKELLIFLANTTTKNPFMRFLREIKPLDIDAALVNEYIEDLSKGVISQDLIDTVECLYQENGYSIDRIEEVNLIGNSQACFDIWHIIRCSEVLQSLINGESNHYETISRFLKEMEYISDDEVKTVLEDIAQECRCFINREEIDIKSFETIKEIANTSYENLKEFIPWV